MRFYVTLNNYYKKEKAEGFLFFRLKYIS